MPRIVFSILTWIILTLAALCGANAQQAPLGVITTTQSITIATASNFQSSTLLTGQNARMSCIIQYEGLATGFIFFGNVTTPVSSTTQTSFQIKPQGFFYCENGSGSAFTVDKNPVWMTSPTTSDIFVIKVK